MTAEHVNQLAGQSLRQVVAARQRLELDALLTLGTSPHHHVERVLRRDAARAFDVLGDGGQAAADEGLTRIERLVEIEDQATAALTGAANAGHGASDAATEHLRRARCAGGVGTRGLERCHWSSFSVSATTAAAARAAPKPSTTCRERRASARRSGLLPSSSIVRAAAAFGDAG